MHVDIITIFPGYFESPLRTGLLGRAIAAGTVAVRVHDLRDQAGDRHRSVDDTPYGGGAGMVMRADVWLDAIAAVVADDDAHVVLLTPRGRPLTQAVVTDLASRPRLVVCCGRYEGIDERVSRAAGADEISIGDYVLAGGEAAALVLVEAVTRLAPDVMGNEASAGDESFTTGLLEYPHYTRPRVVAGLEVPEVLLSGDHAAIDRWRRDEAARVTQERRPDLFERWRAAGGEDRSVRPPPPGGRPDPSGGV